MASDQGKEFETAPGWLRPLLKGERKVLERMSSRLPTTSHLLGDNRDLSNLETTDLGIESAERLVLGGNASPYLLQHVERYVWAMKIIGGQTVIDFGCGEGYGTEMLGWAASSATGLDISSEAVARASRTFEHADYRCLDLCDAESLPSADFGTCFEVLEHLDDPFPVLASIVNCVDRLLFSIPNPLIGGTHINPHHRSDRTIGQWKTMVKEAAAERRAGRPTIRTYHQGVRSATVRRGATMASGVWLFDVDLRP